MNVRVVLFVLVNKCEGVLSQVNAGKKHTGSTEGMQTSVETSELLQHRIHNSVPLRMTTVTQAICDRDFSSLAVETMKVHIRILILPHMYCKHLT